MSPCLFPKVACGLQIKAEHSGKKGELKYQFLGYRNYQGRDDDSLGQESSRRAGEQGSDLGYVMKVEI